MGRRQIGLQRDGFCGVFDGFVELAEIAMGGGEVHIRDGVVRSEFRSHFVVFYRLGGLPHVPVDGSDEHPAIGVFRI